MEWKKEIPNKEGIWLRQCAAKGREDKKIVSKFISEDGTETLLTIWGWIGEQEPINLNDPKFKDKIEAFYWYGPIPLPPDSNRLLVVVEGSGFNPKKKYYE